MNSVSRRVATFLVAAILCVPIAPFAFGASGADRDDLSAKLIRVVKKFQRFVAVISLDDFPIPPRP
jgi:hypothetical protein